MNREGNREKQTGSDRAFLDSDLLLSTIIPHSPIVFFALDREGVFVRSEGSGLDALGLRPGDVVGRSAFEVYRDVPEIVDSLQRALAGEAFTSTVEVSGHYFRTRYEPFKSKDGAVIGVVGLAINITESKRAEKALSQAVGELYAEKAKSEAVIEALGDGISIQDTNFKVLYQNRAQRDLVGDHVGEYCFRAYQKQQDICQGCHLAKAFGDGRIHRQERTVRVGDKTRYVEIAASPLRDSTGRITAGIEIVRDITPRREAEEALKRSEELFRTAFDNAPIGIALVSLDERFLQVNRALCSILGYTKEELLLKHVSDVTHPGDIAAESEHKTQVVSGAEQSFEMTKRYVHADGHVVWGQLNVSLIRDSEGAPLYFIGQLQDITESKKAEGQIKKRDAEISALFDAIPDMMFRISRDGTFLDFKGAKSFNPALPPSEFLGRKIVETMPPGAAQRAMHRIDKALQTGSVETFMYNLTVEERSRQYEARVVPIGTDEVLAIVRDVTEHRYLEEQMRHAQKMEALGTLTGGVAHEFNNILTSIIGYAELLQSGMNKSDPLQSHIERLMASAERAAKLTQSLLAYSRKQVSYLEPIDLNKAVQTMEDFILNLVGENIELKIVIAPEALVIEADRSQIEQVIMNLATNAIDAMPGGGVLTIRSQRVTREASPEPHRDGIRPGAYALLSVEDTGEGIRKEIRSKVFEPFFTTKDVGKGTGLGLSMVFGIVQKHNGYVFFDSEAGRTMFSVYLPLITSEGAARKMTPRSQVAKGSGKVLLAEDEAIVREILRSVLERAGFSVIEAVDGVDAVRKYIYHKDEIDLLLFDVAMPKKNGQKAFEEIRQITPDVKVVFISGYLPDDVRTQAVMDEGFSIVLKPLKSDELLSKIREVLS